MATAKKEAEISSLLSGLSLREKGNELDARSKALQRELDVAGFRIFECLSDCGFFSWNPPNEGSYENLRSIKTVDHFTRYLDLNGTPDFLSDLSAIRTPTSFLNLPPKDRKNQFPYGNLDVICLHVAACYRHVDLEQIDFAFGGSTLEMLASCDATDPYMVTRIPGTNAILVVKNKDYTQNQSDVGFQFERLVTGKSMELNNSEKAFCCTEHLHIMNVGTHRVLFRAETDAISKIDNSPIEIKISNPRYWGSKVMFQMISSGSTKLCHGIRGRGSLLGVSVKPLRQVVKDSLTSGRRMQQMENNILEGMDSIQSQMKDALPGDVFKVSFRKGSLILLQVRGRSADILPPADIVSQLIATRS